MYILSKKQLVRAQSRCWLWDPFVSGISWIAFIVKYFIEQNVIQKILPEMYPSSFPLISKFNVTPPPAAVLWADQAQGAAVRVILPVATHTLVNTVVQNS